MFYKLNDQMTFVEGTNGGKIPFANSFLINDRIKAIIDTGANREDLQQIAADYCPDWIINSHFHVDHTRGNRFFSGAEVFTHPADAEFMSSKEKFLQASGLMVFGEEYLKENFYLDDLPVSQVNRFLEDGQVLEFGKLQLKVLHTPGHTPGHCAFFDEYQEILFAGDIDLTPFGPWYGNPGSDLDQFAASIKKLRDLKPKMVLTGHQEPLTDGIHQRFNEYLQVLDLREEALLRFLAEPKTLSEIVDEKIIYWKHHEPVKIFRWFEKIMIEKHLKRLMGHNLIFEKDGHYRVF